ncbi:Ribonuclease DdI [Sarcoptes scabiei]|uniref:Ribonuclease DdI n=1 Tax=Sarcoptes scabiei TaxID=52283 RepID=A0A834VF86_SARSC|nr:Ribonuclease DdI [Sarcoptes scabiei]UXI17950.1 28S ribosomal protein S26 [Sarcoptes scabiei]
MFLRSSSIFCLIVCVALISGSLSHRHHHQYQNHQRKCSKNTHFDYFLLAAQWPETFCSQHNCIKFQDHWSIHGMWPQNFDQSYPSFCCSNHTYDHRLIKPLESELIAYWKEIQSGKDNDWFWSHEYTKHGTCAIECPLMHDELGYFNSTLQVFKKLQIEKWLARSNITPSYKASYSVVHFQRALQRGSGHKVSLHCSKNHQGDIVVAEIYFCLRKTNLERFDCVLPNSKCGDYMLKYYPQKKFIL